MIHEAAAITWGELKALVDSVEGVSDGTVLKDIVTHMTWNVDLVSRDYRNIRMEYTPIEGIVHLSLKIPEVTESGECDDIPEALQSTREFIARRR